MSRNSVVRCFRVLYTRHLTKKLKSYSDGFVKAKGDGTLELYDEDGTWIKRARQIREEKKFDVGTEGFAGFEGFLVNCDTECETKDIRNSNPEPSKEISQIQSSPVKRLFDKPLPKIGLKKRRKEDEDESISERKGNQRSSDVLLSGKYFIKEFLKVDFFLDNQILNLFFNPESKSKNDVEEIPCGNLTTRISNRQNDVHKPFKPPAMTRPSGRERFESENLDLRFRIFQKRPERLVVVSDGFDSIDDYRRIWKAAIHEEIQLMVDGFSSRIYSIIRSFHEEKKKASKSSSQADSSSLMTWFHQRRIECYTNSSINVFARDKREDDVFLLEIQNITEETKNTAKSTSFKSFEK